tara:strand:+ start:122 stop:445 length:324 start_codon:yes stop_codon:yes gene_type:complete
MSKNTDTDTETNTETKPQENEWAKRECGALWLRQSTNQKYFSGHVTLQDEMGVETKQNLVIFSNKHKKKENHPDFRIYKSEPKGQTSYAKAEAQEETQEAVVEEELI